MTRNTGDAIVRNGCKGLSVNCECQRCRIARVAWANRPQLLSVARRRIGSSADAEDIVSEAITRALEAESVEPERAVSWLTTVTIRLCIDRARDRGRAPKRLHYAVRHSSPPMRFEDDVIDSLHAGQVAALLSPLSAEHRSILQMRADGRSIASIAEQLSVSEKAAESLLGRARVAARAIMSAFGGARRGRDPRAAPAGDRGRPPSGQVAARR
jgi:RNA polymerase sigma factor (sigma-70 family)